MFNVKKTKIKQGKQHYKSSEMVGQTNISICRVSVLKKQNIKYKFEQKM